jgi:hypothetical protein
MPPRPLSTEDYQQTRAAFEKAGTITGAAAMLGLPRSTVQSRLREWERISNQPAPVETEEDRQAIPKGMPFDRAWNTWLEYIGAEVDRYRGPCEPREPKERIRVVAAADFHIPYYHKRALSELILREAEKTDVLIIGGDFGDGQAVSTHVKYEHVPYEVESAEKTLVLQTLSEYFPKIIYLKGSNHADRVEKRIREMLPRDVVAAIAEMTGGVLNPDVAMVKRYPNVELGSWKTPHGIEMGWLTVFGDVAFCHAENYSKVPGSVLRSLEERLSDNKKVWGLPDLRGVVQFHTHAQAYLPWRSDMLLIEPGCMAEPMGYQHSAGRGGRPQRVGYVVMEFEDGKLDFDSVKLRWLE